MSTISAFDWTCEWALARGLKLWSAPEPDSTNRIAKDDVRSATRPLTSEAGTVALPSLYLARRQSAGRGRGTNLWLDADGALLSSWSFGLRLPPQPILAPMVGLALFEAAASIWPKLDFSLKAPNDLYLGTRKLAGLLIELVTLGHEVRCVVGLGFNAGSAPTEVESSAGLTESLGDKGLTRESWRAFLETWLQGLMSAMIDGQKSEIPPHKCERLREALNLHPLLKEPVLRVDRRGELHFTSKTIHWHEL